MKLYTNISESETVKECRKNKAWYILRPCQHDNSYIDGRSQIKVHIDEQIQVHSAQSSHHLQSPIQVLTEVDVP